MSLTEEKQEVVRTWGVVGLRIIALHADDGDTEGKCQCRSCGDDCQVRCANEITEEDLLCDPCRKFAADGALRGHCHLFNPEGEVVPA